MKCKKLICIFEDDDLEITFNFDTQPLSAENKVSAIRQRPKGCFAEFVRISEKELFESVSFMLNDAIDELD